MKQALSDALQARGYETLTQVQVAVSAPELDAADLLVSAQTGSGKTVGFGIAIAPTLLGEAERFEWAEKPLALAIAPTRELALQVARELEWLYAEAGAIIATCVGGMDMRAERRALAKGAHIVVGTPGRLRDHITRGSMDMTGLRAVVLDEADEMLDLGFREDLEFILETAPESRRTLLFSATVPAGIAKLAKNFQKDAVRVTTVAEQKQHSDIEYRAMMVSPRDMENAIINVLRFYEAPNALVFGNTRAMVNRLSTRLSNRGLSVVTLSGELSQTERTHALQAMRDGRARICVATDVAARGIDLPNLDLVIHADLPTGKDTLLHRSGRTGRAGRKGVSALIVTPQSRKKAERILGFAKLRAEWGNAPSAEDVLVADNERLMADPIWTDAVTPDEKEPAAELLERFTPAQIATAFLRMHRDRLSAPEELDDPKLVTAPKPREAFGKSVWFSMARGAKNGAEPRKVLPMLCKAGKLTRDDIGAIRVQPEVSYFELKEAKAEGFMRALGKKMMVEGGAKVELLDKAPDIANSPKPKFKAKNKGKPGGKSRSADAAPIDWNDDPAPRKKKPKSGGKPGAKPSGGKPGAGKYGGAKPSGGKPSGGKFTGEKPAQKGSGKPKKPKAKRKPQS